MMERSFTKILREHMNTYPLMEPQDYGKLIFQSVFGPEHMVTDRQAVREYMREEFFGMTQEATPQVPEDIGNGLCRFPLGACPSMEAAELLTDLFILTAEERSTAGKESRGIDEEGSPTRKEESGIKERQSEGKKYRLLEELREKLEQVEGLGIPGMEEWAQQWQEMGYPPVHHSKVYSEAYHPHYRLLQKEYAIYFPVLWKIYELIADKKTVIVGIDGRCGSGKTSFAQLIARIFSCNVIHTDDFYLPLGGRAEDWTEIPGGNMDFTRLRLEVLKPIQAEEVVYYRPYHCQEGVYGEALQLALSQLVIVEGSYSHHPLLAEAYDLKVFLTCSKDVQMKRLQAREGSYFDMFEKRWIPMEENYFQHFSVEENSDLVVETDGFM